MLKILPLLLITSASYAGNTSFLQIAKDVPKDQQALLQSDLDRLNNGKSINVTDPNFNRVMDMSGPVTGDSLLTWLSQRIRYVVSGDLDLQQSFYVEDKSYSFQNPGVTPDIPEVPKRPDNGPDKNGRKVVTVMTNIGGAVYVIGKQQDMLLGLKIPGVGKVPVSSPRVGVLQVGEGLFMVRKGVQKVQDVDASMERLSTLFHEARHSDGNGKTLGMLHDICPEGHNLEGYAACDFSLNGSYSVGAQVGKVLAENCKECTAAQKENLRLDYLDSFSRVITEKKDAAADYNDDAYDVLRKSCADLKKLGLKDLPEICSKLEQAQNQPKGAPGIKAQYLDSRPEGKIEKHRGFFGLF